ncbi:MAG: TetR family transcriptional regulator [Desulfobulbaceae bacterium A2]|nr:MAG: TetR family transcriptional regulator [Desulfobulbaceae bacterium A2]
MRISEQAKQECRSRILAQAATLFIAKGFEDTTTRDIATAAGLAVGTLFNYFPSKETLAMTMVSEALGQGLTEYRRRRSGSEELVEELYLFIAAGLRCLRPLRPFLGPVLERSLSPFPRKTTCPEGEAARLEHLSTVQGIIDRHGFSQPPDQVVLTLYWSLYLGVLACWTNDSSPGQGASQALIDYSLRLFVRMISGDTANAGDDHAP